MPKAASETYNCKVCGNLARPLLSMLNDHGEPPLLDIARCSECGLLFVRNSPTEAQLRRAYASLGFEQYYEETAAASEGKISRAVSDVRDLLEARPPGDAVLDVGCGHGHFLEGLRSSLPGVLVVGYEFDEESARACQRRGLQVHTGELAGIGRRFAVVTLLDVAQHLPDPCAAFATCNELLDEGGYLYLHTPRRCFWDAVAVAALRLPGAGRLARGWLRTRVSVFHLQLWTDRALRRALERTGFRLVYLVPQQELSWPIERYVKVYLGSKLGASSVAQRLCVEVAKLLFVR